MKSIDDVNKQFLQKDLLSPEGMAQYAEALIGVQRQEQIPLMEELKQKQEYHPCDDDEKELFAQILNGYKFSAEECLPDLEECYMQFGIKKNEQGMGYDMSCTFCRETKGRSFWVNLSPADYFLIIQLAGNYKPGPLHTIAPYFFFKEDIVDIADEIIKSQTQQRTSRKKVKIVR